MKRALIWLGAVIAVLVVGRCGVQYMQERGVTYEARRRVQRTLDELAPRGDHDRALDMWYRGYKGATMGLTINQANAVAVSMSQWLAAKGLKDTISSYTIDRVVFVKEREGYQTSIARVSCTIDGKSLALLVARDEPIVWDD
jgi:hypothetical protein